MDNISFLCHTPYFLTVVPYVCIAAVWLEALSLPSFALQGVQLNIPQRCRVWCCMSVLPSPLPSPRLCTDAHCSGHVCSVAQC